jgi:hypothetical protein
MKKTKLLIFLAFLFSFAIVHGQNVFVINLNDDTTVSTPFSDIQEISFNDDKMLLKTVSGENSYSLDAIASITFLEEVGINENPNPIDINIYVNASGEIVVESPHQINQLSVYDLSGRQVALSSQNKLNVNFLPTGLFILQVATDQGYVSKKFIKN